MAYRSDFYNLQNIIGYSGNLNAGPTVYFRCDQMQLVGRITQQHPRGDNIGRGKPRSTQGYEGRNEFYDGQARFVERVNGTVFHTSRNIFIRVGMLAPNAPGSGVDLGALSILAQAIYRFPYAKTRVSGARAFRTAFHAKNRVMQQLKRSAQIEENFIPTNVVLTRDIIDVI